LPQVPQLGALPVRSTQALRHLVSPGAQAEPHLPSEHTCAAAHAVPHAPQLAASELSSRHWLPHELLPVAQASPPLPPLPVVVLPPPDEAPVLDVPAPALPPDDVPRTDAAPATLLPFVPASVELFEELRGVAPPAQPTTIVPAPRMADTLWRSRVRLGMVFLIRRISNVC
jgi:hypothetical protein